MYDKYILGIPTLVGIVVAVALVGESIAFKANERKIKKNRSRARNEKNLRNETTATTIPTETEIVEGELIDL